MNQKFTFSWERFPALYILASLLSGAALYYGIFIPLIFSLTHKKRSFQIGYLSLALFTSLLFFLNKNDLPLEGKQFVTAYIQPLKLKESHHRLFLTASCPYLITEDGKEYKNLQLIIAVPKKIAPSLDHDQIISGILKKSSYGYFLKGEKWTVIKYSSSSTWRRFTLHKKAIQLIKKYVSDSDVKAYFCALVTGNISDPFLRARFSENGMLHTLAISGFHFSWILFLLSIPLSLLLPKKYTIILLLLLSWCYFLFLGGSSSISRAWIAISIYFLTVLFSKTPLPLNALGLAGIISIILNPYSAFELSFSLSFLATFSILTLFPLIKNMVNRVCPKRNPQTLHFMPLIDKLAYYPLRFFLTSLSLSLLIQIMLLPLFIHFFPFLSLWGLFYNIFIPLSMIPTLILLLTAFLLHPLIGSSLVWKLNEAFSKPFLETILYGSGSASLLLKLPTISPHFLAGTLCLLLLICLHIEKFFHEESLIKQDEFLLT